MAKASITLLVLASFCFFAQATSVYQTPEFLQIKKSGFGHSLTSLVEMNMNQQDSGRLQAINDLLSTINQSLASQQDSNENKISGQRGWCIDEKKSQGDKLNSATNDEIRYKNEQSGLIKEEGEQKDALDKENNDKNQNESSKKSREDDLAAENIRFSIASKNYAEAIAACQQSLNLVATVSTNASSFLQLKTSFSNVVALMQKNLQSHKSPLIAPVLTVLNEIASSNKSIDQAKLSKITSLIQQLLDELRKQQSSNIDNNNNSVKSLNDQILSLGELIEKNTSSIQKYEERIKEIQDRLEQLIKIIDDLVTLISVLENQINNTNNSCNSYEAQYLSNKTTISGQIDILAQVRDYFEKKIAPSVKKIDDATYQDSLSF